MDESGLGQGDVRRLLEVDALARQCLDDAPVVQLTVVRVSVDVG